MSHNFTTPPPGNSFRNEGGDFANLRVLPQDPPNLTVQITEGTYWNNTGQYMEFTGASSVSISRPSGANQARLVLVGINEFGNATTVLGTIATVSASSLTTEPQPSLPDAPSNFLPLAAVRVRGVDTTIQSNRIFDLRTAQKMTF